MFSLNSSETSAQLRASSPSRTWELRNECGNLVRRLSYDEAAALAFHDLACGRASKGGLRYLQLTAPLATATECLRRMAASSGRMVAEASQLVSRTWVPGGVVYSHIPHRTRGYDPALRLQTV
jgi:hypothetical protein